MAESNFTVIVVGHTEKDQYGNLLVTPQGGGDKIKIAQKRANLHPLFEQGKAIKLDWQTYMNKPYVADAVAVAGKLPLPKEPTVYSEHPAIIERAKESVKEPVKLSTEDTRIRAMAVAYSKDLVVADKIKLDQLKVYADKFVDYIQNKEVQPVRKSLAEEALKLGAIEVKKET